MIGKILFLICALGMIIVGVSIYKEPAWYDHTFNMSFHGSGYNEVLGSVLVIVGILMLFPIIKIIINHINES